MSKITLDYSDGRYSAQALTAEEDANHDGIVYLADSVWESYLRHCGHDHQKLDEATAQQLRTCGFDVEHDSEEI